MVLREFYTLLILHPPILYGYGRNQCHWLEPPFFFHSSFSRLPLVDLPFKSPYAGAQ